MIVMFQCYCFDPLQSSGVSLYQNLYQKMLSDPAGLPDSNSAGMARVMEGDYAYFLESPSAEYHVSHHCDLTTVGGNLDSKGYGIVLPQGNIVVSVCVFIKLREGIAKTQT